MIETTIALCLLAVAALSVLGTMVFGLQLDATNRETVAASQAARRVIEQIRAEDLSDVVSLYNDDDTDDPDGREAPGSRFSVTLLEEVVANMDDAGTVLLPVDGDGRVREDLEIPELGMPRDLNGDGVVDALDHTDDLIVLPVLVRVSWTGINGPRALDFRTVLR